MQVYPQQVLRKKQQLSSSGRVPHVRPSIHGPKRAECSPISANLLRPRARSRALTGSAFARKAKKRHSPSSGVFCVSDGAVRYGPRPLSCCIIGSISYESIPYATGPS
jgi:hypothetical protein